MSWLAYEHQNDVLCIRYADGHRYVIHFYYVLGLYSLFGLIHRAKKTSKN